MGDRNVFIILLISWMLEICVGATTCPVTSLPNGWTLIHDGPSTCYALSDTKTNQVEARNLCWQNFRGHLGRFPNVETLKLAAENIRLNTNLIWMDLIHRESDNIWSWSDGYEADTSILSRRLAVGERIVSVYHCGALTSSSQQKFTEWTSEDCYANHEFICQAPKGPNVEDAKVCPANSFYFNSNCYTLSTKIMTFADVKNECMNHYKGRLASLEHKELAIVTANYIDLDRKDLKTVRIWLDMTWDAASKNWKHGDGTTVSAYEANWYSTDNTLGEAKSGVVADQSSDWRWRARNPEWRAYGLCEVNPNTWNGSGTSNDSLVTSTASATTSTPSVGIGSALILLVLLICVTFCCFKYWCNTSLSKMLSGRKKNEDSSGYGTPVSFRFMNPEYDHAQEMNSVAPGVELRSPSIRVQTQDGDETYATINDIPVHARPPEINCDNVHQYAVLTDSNLLHPGGSTSHLSTGSCSLVRHSPRFSIPTPEHRRQMSSFSMPEEDRISPVPGGSPSYAEMNGSRAVDQNQGDDLESSSGLQYAELTFHKNDEDDRFLVHGSSQRNSDRSERATPGEEEESCYVENMESITRKQFQQKYPQVVGQQLSVKKQDYENNEISPLIISPASPQFPRF